MRAPRPLVTIEESAVRQNMPTGRLNPDQVSGASFGGGIARGLQALGAEGEAAAEVLHDLEVAKKREEIQTQEFGRQTTLVNMAASERQRLVTESREIKGDGTGFTEDFLGAFDQRSEEFLATVPEPRQEEWRARLSGVRAELAGDVLKSEFSIRDAHYGLEIDTAIQSGLSQIAAKPEDAETVRGRLRESVVSSLLPEDEKQRRLALIDQQTAFAYGAAIGERSPSELMRLLGGPVTGAGEFRVDGARNDNERTAVNYLRSEGLNSYGVAGAVAVLSWEGAGMNPNAVNKGDGADGSDSIGIGQWNGDRAKALKAFAAARGKPWNDLETQLAFFMQELKTSEPEAYRRLQNARSVEDAVEAMSYYERPRGWERNGDRTKVIHWNERVARATTIAGTRADADDPAPAESDPILARLRFEDRMRLRGFAEKGVADAERTAAAAAQAEQAEKVNALELRLMDNKAGQADIDAARREGILDDANDVARLQNIVDQRNKVDQDFAGYVAATGLGPGFEWNPFDGDHRDMAEAGVKAQGGTPQAAFEVWQRTGILADSGAARLRQGLASTDPAQVRAAATIAARMLQRKPTAFQGAEGASEMETAALLYARRIELGDTEEQAAQRVAQLNDPTYRSRVKVADEDAKAFRERLRKEDPTPAIIRALGAGPGLFQGAVPLGSGAAERATILQDYADLASDHYAQYGDADLARAFALNRMKAMYGRSQTIGSTAGVRAERVTRYPPEAVYPSVNGDHRWLYRQAAADIKRATGRTIDPNDIQFVPIAGVTADAWRARRAAPYTIQYAETINGQRVIRTLNGKAFVGTTRPGSTGSDARRSAFEAERRRKEAESRRWLDRSREPDRQF